MSRPRGSNLISIFLMIILLGVCGLGGYTLFRDMSPPALSVSPLSKYTSPSQKFTLTATDKASGLRSINVSVKKNDRVFTVLDKVFNAPKQSETLTFTLADVGIKEGSLELEIKATDNSNARFGRGNIATRVFPLIVDITPPRFNVKTLPPYVRRGGAACVLYSLNKEVVKTGIKVGELFFPAFKQTKGDYLVFFAFPFNLVPNEYAPNLWAEDVAGNIASIPLAVNRINKEFKRDVLNISNSFLDSKMPEFVGQVPGEMSNLERFIKVNNDLRKANQATLMEIGTHAKPEILWQGVFMRLPNAAPRAGFADHRTYMHNKQKIDEQYHLGHDLASLVQATVPAANNGVVLFAGDLGIYGNIVVIEHGMGLQTLYSHLSDFSVSVGQEVKKGDIIGRTGKTGMAGGDHLHFGVTVSGVEVNPTEWLDAHWIKDNMVDRVVSAGGDMPPMRAIDAAAATASEITSSTPGNNQLSTPGTATPSTSAQKPPTSPTTSGAKPKKPRKPQQ